MRIRMSDVASREFHQWVHKNFNSHIVVASHVVVTHLEIASCQHI